MSECSFACSQALARCNKNAPTAASMQTQLALAPQGPPSPGPLAPGGRGRRNGQLCSEAERNWERAAPLPNQLPQTGAPPRPRLRLPCPPSVLSLPVLGSALSGQGRKTQAQVHSGHHSVSCSPSTSGKGHSLWLFPRRLTCPTAILGGILGSPWGRLGAGMTDAQAFWQDCWPLFPHYRSAHGKPRVSLTARPPFFPGLK